MQIKAIDLLYALRQYSEEELENLDIVIETKRSQSGALGISEYANLIELYPSQIRIINKKGK